MNSTRDKQIIRDLAKRVAEIAADPVNDQKRDMWTRQNGLERVRPLIYVQAIEWRLWDELILPQDLQASDDFVREQELELRKRIYSWEHFPDDRVVDAVVACPITIQGDVRDTWFGLERDLDQPENLRGAHRFRPVVATWEDLDKIEVEPELSVDWQDTEKRYQRLCDLYDDTLPIEKRGPNFFWFSPMDHLIQWCGIEEAFIALIERPRWIHAALERITQGYLSNIEQLETLGVLSPGHGNIQLGSGGFAWTDELPQLDFDGTHVRIKDLWARAATQIFTDGISADMHDEFAIQYEKRLLERFGLSCYGCCEPLDRKMHIVRQIANLRRVSMSPWVDVARAAEAVGRDYVYTHKTNPSIVTTHRWDPDLAREELRDAFQKTRDNVVEVNLQDILTVNGEPRRLAEWTQMAIQLAEEFA